MSKQRTLERSTLEAYGGIAIAVFIVVIPLHWWVQASLVGVVGLLAGDISFHAPWFHLWSKVSKMVLWLISIAILITVSWQPIHEQFIKDGLPTNNADLQRFGQELIELSSDISTFITDRDKQAPSTGPENKNAHEAWEKGRQYKIETAHSIEQRFGSRMLSDVIELKNMGVNAPWVVQISMDAEPEAMGRWLGAMGRLLRIGRLQEAISTGPDQKLWWNLAQ